MEKLVPEVWEQIAFYCSLEDMKNLSLTSSLTNQNLKSVLFFTSKIPKSCMNQKHLKSNQKLSKQLRNLFYARLLNLKSGPSSVCREVFRSISRLDSLLGLNMSWSSYVNDNQFTILCKGLSNLQQLNIAYTGVTDTGLGHIGNLTCLVDLSLMACKITDTGVKNLIGLKNLKALDLSLCNKLTDKTLCHVSSVVSLQRLLLCCCRGLTDLGVRELHMLVGLVELDLGHCNKVTDAGVSELERLVNLERLGLVGCGVTSECVRKMVEVLTNLKTRPDYDISLDAYDWRPVT